MLKGSSTCLASIVATMGKAAATDDVEAVRQHDGTAGCIALTDAQMDVLR